MLSAVEIVVLCIFGFFYVGLIYNLPVLAAGVRDLRRSRRGAKKQGSALDDSLLPRFSVILPVKNEEKVIGRLLGGLSRVNYPADKFEIVIVDDGSVDRTAQICREFAGNHRNVQFLHRPASEGKASALNYGLKRCSGDIVGIFDADNVVAEDLLAKAAAHFQDAKVAAVQGRISSVNSRQNMLTQFIAYEDAVWSEAFLRGKEALGLFVSLRGCCEFVRKDVLDSMSGFDEGSMAEDIEISARLTQKGHRIKYAGDFGAGQESPATFRAFFKQRTRWFRGHMEIAFKYGRLLRHLNRRTVDAEFTLFLPLVAIASFFSFSAASWGVFTSVAFNAALRSFMVFSTAVTSLLFVLTGLALIYISKPKRVKNVLWLPFVFIYWSFQSVLAVYALLLIVFRRPRKWLRTEKSGALSEPEIAVEPGVEVFV